MCDEISFCVKCLILILCCTAIFAQAQADGGLSADMIQEIRSANRLSTSDRVIMNALTNNELLDLVLSHDFLVQHNDLFSHVIETKGITDQEQSGRCWLFAGLNTLRQRVMKRYDLPDFELSQNHLFFWDKMEKANTFLEYIIETWERDLYDRELQLMLKRPISDGGYWSYVANLVSKYGVVPKSAMPETKQSRSSWIMASILSMMLRKDAMELRSLAQQGVTLAELRLRKQDMLNDVYRLLVLHLGEPPDEFEWRYETKKGDVSQGKDYTPSRFYQEIVGKGIGEYVALMNYPGKEYSRLYRLENARNMIDCDDPMYANLDIEDLKKAALASVLDSEPVWFACDIGQDRDSEHGILSTRIFEYQTLLGVDLTMSKEERIASWESSGNHAMVFIGVDLKEGKPVKWLVEDSHGSDRGHSGKWTLYDDWFNEFVYVVIVNKKYLPERILEVFDQEPIILPPWDPMVRMWTDR
jgi:bleomycin hydrolase